MKPFNKKTLMLGVGIIFVAAVIAVTIVFLPKQSLAPTQQAMTPHPTPGNQIAAEATSTAPVKMAPIPHGSQTYQIMQAASATPKILQATVNPVDVHVGDTQTLTVILSDPNPITSVVASIQTDNGTTTLPLSLVGPATSNDVMPQQYSVNAANQLTLAAAGKIGGTVNVAQAAQGDEKYSATWTVKDTHVAKYFTTFTATDAEGNMNSVKIAWTDALCAWTSNNYNSSTWSLSSNYATGCTLRGGDIDGAENGNLSIDNASFPLIINGNLMLNPGNQISFANGGYLLISGGSIVVGQMYGTDVDQDGYIAGSGWSTSSGAGSVRSSISTPTIGFSDCNDSNANVFPGQTAFFTTATTTNVNPSTGPDGGGEVNFNYNCQTPLNYQSNGPVGSITGPGGCSGPNTCNPTGFSPGVQFATFPCGSAVAQYVDFANSAACQNNGVPTGHLCDVISTQPSGATQACN